MSINATVSRMENGGWLFEWTTGTPPYSIYLDGKLIEQVTDEEYEFTRPNYETYPPDLEILSDGDDSESIEYPPYMVLQWRGVQSAFAYVVEHFEDSAWVPVATIREDDRGYYNWETPALEDDSAEQYRVKATDPLGNTGTALPFTFTVVRNPAAPNPTLTIDSSGDVVVS